MPDYTNDIYDVEKAFKAIEDELMASMMRNMQHHRDWEDDEGFRWSQWQTEQLKALEKYKMDNRSKFTKQFSDINSRIDSIITAARQQGGMDQEIGILKAIKEGHLAKRAGQSLNTSGEFFRLNTNKLNALINATHDDFAKAEFAMLRHADDQYRKIIFNAQMYANSGAATYAKAVDMATKDFLSRGITCIEYKNGARHTMADYASMCLRTASKRAYLTGEGEKRQEWGEHLVILNKRGNACPLCLPFVGKILIDDVWSGGSAADGDYPLMSTAMEAGLYHPNCKDGHTTYFPELEDIDQEYSKKELRNIQEDYQQEQQGKYAKRQADKYGRLAEYSLDSDNKEMYQNKQQQWIDSISKYARFRTGNKSTKEYVESKRPLANFKALPKESVVDVLRNESEEWIKTLTGKEKHAIKKYTYNSQDTKANKFYQRLNAMLRGDMPCDDLLNKYSDSISNGLKKCTLKHDVVCYRNIEKDVYKDRKVGEIFRERQFTSTSVLENAAMKKPYKITIFVPRGTRAGYIESLSSFDKQKELLLDKNTRFRVLSKEENSITLEAII